MARFAMADSQDQSAVVWIMTFLLLSYTTLTTLVRAAVKFRMLGFDDGVAVLAQLLAYGHAFCVIYALVLGLPGRSIRRQTINFATQGSVLFEHQSPSFTQH